MTSWRDSLGFSSIAWDPKFEGEIADILTAHQVKYVDITPTKYMRLGSPDARAQSEALRHFWESRGFRIRAMQSLLFQLPGKSIFNRSDWQDLFSAFRDLQDTAEWLGATKLVFGSPGNRRLGDMNIEDGHAMAKEFFGAVSDILGDGDTQLLIEGNPVHYNCDFLTSTLESIDFVRDLDKPNIRVQLDLGTCFYTGEKPLHFPEVYWDWIGYIHLSVEDLVPLYSAPNETIIEFIRNYDGTIPVAIEQKTEVGVPNESVRRTLKWVESI